jgi:ferredoxin
MAAALLPLLRPEDKIRCVGCRDCVRACFLGVLETYNQEVPFGDAKVVLSVPVLENPELCDHEGRCLVACSQNVYPCLWPQDVDEVKEEAQLLIEKSKTLEVNTIIN